MVAWLPNQEKGMNIAGKTKNITENMHTATNGGQAENPTKKKQCAGHQKQKRHKQTHTFLNDPCETQMIETTHVTSKTKRAKHCRSRRRRKISYHSGHQRKTTFLVRPCSFASPARSHARQEHCQLFSFHLRLTMLMLCVEYVLLRLI